MYLLIAIASLIMSTIAWEKNWNILKVLFFLIGLVLLVLIAIDVWVHNFGLVM